MSQRLGDGEQKRVKIAPATQDLKSERPLTRRRKGDAGKGFIALEQVVNRRELSESLGRQGAALVPAHEAPEPFPQAPRLVCKRVELARERTHTHVPKNVAWDQAGLLEPAQIAFAIMKPIDGGIDGRRDRIEEIQPTRPPDKDRRRAVHHTYSLLAFLPDGGAARAPTRQHR